MRSKTHGALALLAEASYRAAGLNVFGNYRWLRGTLGWSQEQRSVWRLDKLNKILEFCWIHSAFYREFWGDSGLSWRPLRSIAELEAYPVLKKDVFKGNAKRIAPDCVRRIRHINKSTGGTTGEPVQYLQDLEQWAFCEGFHLWGWEQCGYEFGDPVAVLAGGSLLPSDMRFTGKLRNLLQNRMFLFGVAMNAERAKEFWHKLESKQVRYLYGYPSIISAFSEHLREVGLRVSCLRAVVCTAEMLLPQYRQRIEKNFGVPVFDNVGCNDGGFEAYECSLHEGFHYNDLQSILEVDDSQGKDAGNLRITNLWNKSSPFVRYENGDIASLSREKCQCGIAFPVISSLEGRTADLLTFADGTSISGPALTLIFRDMDIGGWQVVLRTPETLEIRVCCGPTIMDEYKSHIMNVMREYVPKAVQIELKAVEQLEVTRAGKRKPIWSEVKG